MASKFSQTDTPTSYEVLTVFLIEAVKEQHKEIEALQKALKNHELMEP